jgi:2-aminoethylphosphonate-pyruvate transaminase
LLSSGGGGYPPPIQALAALAAALRQYRAEGQPARLERVRRNWRCLVDGLRAQGFETVLADEVAAPVIATFHQPADPRYDRERFFQAMWRRGFVMFRGSLTPFPTFRIGCMGALDEAVMAAVVRAVGEAMAEIGVRDCRPATR